MNWFVVIGLGAMALGIIGVWLLGKLRKGKPVGSVAVFLACALIVLGFVQMLVAGLEGKQNPEGVAGVVTKVTIQNYITTLTVQVGENSLETHDIDCLPEQKACQAAHIGDLVQYDRTTHPSGWVSYREIRFITKGANSP